MSRGLHLESSLNVDLDVDSRRDETRLDSTRDLDLDQDLDLNLNFKVAIQNPSDFRLQLQCSKYHNLSIE